VLTKILQLARIGLTRYILGLKAIILNNAFFSWAPLSMVVVFVEL
jgi:hypothetical protein